MRYLPLGLLFLFLAGCSILDYAFGVAPDGSASPNSPAAGVGGLVSGLGGPWAIIGAGLAGLGNVYQFFRGRQLRGEKATFGQGISAIVSGIDNALAVGVKTNVGKDDLYKAIQEAIHEMADDAKAIERLIATIKAQNRAPR